MAESNDSQAAPPKAIYLQYYGDDEPDDGQVDDGDVTWCRDKIFKHDLKYVRAVSWLDAAEIRAALLSTLPYYEADDKDDYHYLVKERDIDKAVEAIVAAGRAKASSASTDGAQT